MPSTNFEHTMAGLQNALHVAHVAAHPLHSAQPSDSVGTVRSWAQPATINNVPVSRDGHVVGVLENISGDLPGEPSLDDDAAAAAHAMRPLAGDMLVEGRRPLDGFVHELLERPYYRLVVRDGNTDAIVTPSDLNKLPVRVYAYALVAHLEATMLEAIKRSCSPEEAIELLPGGGAVQIQKDYERLAHGWLNPSLLTMTSFKQKGEILGALGVFRVSDRKSISEEFEGVYNRLRNPLMHSGDYVNDSLEKLRTFTADLGWVSARTQQAAEGG